MCLHVQVVAVLASLLDHIAAGHLTRPECGAGDESTPSGASGARDGMPHVFRHSSWTHPCSPDKVVYLQFFHVASTQFSAYIYLVPCSALCSWLCQSASREFLFLCYCKLLLIFYCYHIFLHFQYIEAMHWCVHVSMLM